jgi:hypothetical protein
MRSGTIAAEGGKEKGKKKKAKGKKQKAKGRTGLQGICGRASADGLECPGRGRSCSFGH